MRVGPASPGITATATERSEPMSSKKPAELYVASYSDLQAAGRALADLQQLEEEGTVELDALALVNRDQEGKIHVDEHTHDVRHGSKVGVVGGLVVGAIFPPSLLASGVVGGAVGAGVGSLRAHHSKKEIKADAEQVLSQDTSGIVVVCDEQATAEVGRVLENADLIKKETVDRDSADEVKAGAEVTETIPS
jgi:uncharacterized membrane protein